MIAEVQKEVAEFKAHIERMTNNTDMPMLKPIKSIINEQVTVMFSFMNEIKEDLKRESGKIGDVHLKVHQLEDTVLNIKKAQKEE